MSSAGNIAHAGGNFGSTTVRVSWASAVLATSSAATMWRISTGPPALRAIRMTEESFEITHPHGLHIGVILILAAHRPTEDVVRRAAPGVNRPRRRQGD